MGADENPGEPLVDLNDGRTELAPWVYEELRALARRQMRSQGRPITLQTTALVHEAWIRVNAGRETDGFSSLHFRELAATAMRSVLVDLARRRNAQKRGDGQRAMPLEEKWVAGDGAHVAVLALDDCLSRLAELDPALGRIAELRCFSGLEHREIAAALDMPLRSVERAWRTAKAWLLKEIEPGGTPLF